MRAAAATALAPRTAPVSLPSPPRLVHVAQGFSVSRALTGLLRGRAWIGLLTVLLLGIVFMQVHMLKLNAGISRAVETTGTLERQNSQLRQEVSQLGAADRIEDASTALGMVMPQPGSVRYLGARDEIVDAKQAAATMTAPDPQAAVAAATAQTAAAPATTAPAPVEQAVAPATTETPAAQAPVAQAPAAATQQTTPPATQQTEPAAVPPAATASPATATGGATPTP